MLVECHLQLSKVWTRISNNIELIHMFTNGLLHISTLSTTEATQYSSALEIILSKCQCDLFPLQKHLLSFFGDFFGDTNDSKAERVAVANTVLRALNLYLVTNALDFPLEAQDLGERMILSLDAFWRKTNSELFKLDICNFFRIIFKLNVDKQPLKGTVTLYLLSKDALNQRTFTATSRS